MIQIPYYFFLQTSAKMIDKEKKMPIMTSIDTFLKSYFLG